MEFPNYVGLLAGCLSSVLLCVCVFCIWMLYRRKCKYKTIDDDSEGSTIIISQKQPLFRGTQLHKIHPQKPTSDSPQKIENQKQMTFTKKGGKRSHSVGASMFYMDETMLKDWNASCSDPYLYNRPSLDEGLNRRHSAGQVGSIIQKSKPIIHLNTTYMSDESSFVVRVRKIVNLPPKYKTNCCSFVRVFLLPKYPDHLQTRVVRGTLDPKFGDHLRFRKLTFATVCKSYLRCKVYIKKLRDKKDTFVGEIFMSCIDMTPRPDETTYNEIALKPERTKMKKVQSLSSLTTEFDEERSVGNMFLSIEYQSYANRIKVMLRKANRLARTNRLPGTADHYVVVNLLLKDRTVQTETSRSIVGYSPTWNQPFLFHLHNDEDIDNYSIQLVIMKDRFYRVKSEGGVFGQVQIGRNSPLETGKTHWSEVMKPKKSEVALWHRILPLQHGSPP